MRVRAVRPGVTRWTAFGTQCEPPDDADDGDLNIDPGSIHVPTDTDVHRALDG